MIGFKEAKPGELGKDVPERLPQERDKNLGEAGERKREAGRQWEGEVGRERGREKWERKKRLLRRKGRRVRDMEHKGRGRKG